MHRVRDARRLGQRRPRGRRDGLGPVGKPGRGRATTAAGAATALGGIDRGQTVTQSVRCVPVNGCAWRLPGTATRAATGSSGYTDALTADLDLRVTTPDGTVVGSYTLDNAYEFVEVTIERPGTARSRSCRRGWTPERSGSGLPGQRSAPSRRLAGADRYATAAAISRSGFGAGRAGRLRGHRHQLPRCPGRRTAWPPRRVGPSCCRRPTACPRPTATELARLRPATIVVLGGSGRVSDTVLTALRAYATSGSVTPPGRGRPLRHRRGHQPSGFGPGVPVAYVATGTNFPDALAAGPRGRPGGWARSCCRRPTACPRPTATELARLRPATIVVLGAAGAVSDRCSTALRPYATSGSVTRLAGADRYATAAAISRVRLRGRACRSPTWPPAPTSPMPWPRDRVAAQAGGPDPAVGSQQPVLGRRHRAGPPAAGNDRASWEAHGGPRMRSSAELAGVTGLPGQCEAAQRALRHHPGGRLGAAVGILRPAGPSPSAEVRRRAAPASSARPPHQAEPGRPYDAAAVLAAMRDSRRPGGVADSSADRADCGRRGRPAVDLGRIGLDRLAMGGGCGADACRLEVTGSAEDPPGATPTPSRSSRPAARSQLTTADLHGYPATLEAEAGRDRPRPSSRRRCSRAWRSSVRDGSHRRIPVDTGSATDPAARRDRPASTSWWTCRGPR